MAFLSYRNLKILIQLAFWLGYITIATLVFSMVVPPQWALMRTLMMASVHILLVYFHLYFILPRFFDKKKYLQYGALLAVSLTIAVLLKSAGDRLLIEWSDLNGPLARYKDGNVPILSGLVADLVFLFITTPVRWMDEFYKRKALQERFQTHRLAAELKFLKTQVNPHFLFNTLNNLYSLAYTGSEKTAPMILKLSEMMRYMLYESDAEQVPLDKEIQYIQNYIQLQQLKTEEEQQIIFEVLGETAGLQLPPMLFVPLVENAFKHGNLEENGWLKAKIEVEDKRLIFSIHNSFRPHQQKDPVGGIGLENVRKRLQLLFPEKHEFNVEEKDGVFGVRLIL